MDSDNKRDPSDHRCGLQAVENRESAEQGKKLRDDNEQVGTPEPFTLDFGSGNIPVTAPEGEDGERESRHGERDENGSERLGDRGLLAITKGVPNAAPMTCPMVTVVRLTWIPESIVA